MESRRHEKAQSPKQNRSRFYGKRTDAFAERKGGLMLRALAAPDKFGGIDRQLFELTVPRNGLGSSRAWTSLLAYPRSLWSKTRLPLPTRKAAAVTTGGRPTEETSSCPRNVPAKQSQRVCDSLESLAFWTCRLLGINVVTCDSTDGGFDASLCNLGSNRFVGMGCRHGCPLHQSRSTGPGRDINGAGSVSL